MIALVALLAIYLLNGFVLALRLRATDGIGVRAAMVWVVAWPALLAWHAR